MYHTYQEVLNFVNSDSAKIKAVVFAIENCTTCDDFLPDVFDVEIANRSEHFESIYIDIRNQDIPFPPNYAPTFYFFIPGTQEPMPLIRSGGTIPELLQKDLDAMIKVKDQGITLMEAYKDVQISEPTAWIQRLVRF